MLHCSVSFCDIVILNYILLQVDKGDQQNVPCLLVVGDAYPALETKEFLIPETVLTVATCTCIFIWS